MLNLSLALLAPLLSLAMRSLAQYLRAPHHVLRVDHDELKLVGARLLAAPHNLPPCLQIQFGLGLLLASTPLGSGP